MTDAQNPSSAKSQPPSKSTPRINGETSTNGYLSGQKVPYQNPPEHSNPDPATLREQWRFAIRQYSRWYSHAWGTAILAGISFFALGWIIKGSNPLPSRHDQHPQSSPPSSSAQESEPR